MFRRFGYYNPAPTCYPKVKSPKLWEVVEVRESRKAGIYPIDGSLTQLVKAVPVAEDFKNIPAVADQIRYREANGFAVSSSSDNRIVLEDGRGNSVTYKARIAKIAVTVPDGIYTLAPIGEKDEYTFKISTVKNGNSKLYGKRLIHIHTGTNLTSDFTSAWTTIGQVQDDGMFIWSKTMMLEADSKVLRSLPFAYQLLQMDENLWLESGRLFAQRSNRCFRCGKRLIKTGSLEKSVGPDCEKILMKSNPELLSKLACPLVP